MRLDGFAKSDEGQDLIEYSLLLAFLCLVCAAALIGLGANVSALWMAANDRLANAGN